MEEHNIFHSEVEALAPHISTSGDKVHVLVNHSFIQDLQGLIVTKMSD